MTFFGILRLVVIAGITGITGITGIAGIAGIIGRLLYEPMARNTSNQHAGIAGIIGRLLYEPMARNTSNQHAGIAGIAMVVLCVAKFQRALDIDNDVTKVLHHKKRKQY